MEKQSNSKIAKYFNPILRTLREFDGAGRPYEVINYIVETEDIATEDEELLPNGTIRYEKDINWARFYLYKTGYIDNSKRGVWILTNKGKETPFLDNQAISDILDTVRNKATDSSQNISSETDSDPEPHRVKLKEILYNLSSKQFENLSQLILDKAGFDNVQVTGGKSDGGIDGTGILHLNPLLSTKINICFQCKRYTKPKKIVPGIVREFHGAILGRAERGIIFTTSTFTKEASEEAKREGTIPIELIDLKRLVEILEDLELGLKRDNDTYTVDDKFFSEIKN